MDPRVGEGMIVQCPHCNINYDDFDHYTFCPHERFASGGVSIAREFGKSGSSYDRMPGMWEPTIVTTEEPDADVNNPFERVMPPPEAVDHPAHYNASPSGVECIDVVEHLPFNVGNAMKYLWRCDHKNGLEDLRKAAWYVAREIERREKDNAR